jgi:hypothetical protein
MNGGGEMQAEGMGSTAPRGSGIDAFLGRPWLVAACLAVATFAIGMALSLANWPVPRVHDEFSYLLAADTFAHGRLTNPTHPMWERFETFHVIQQPTYASKYPPGQGAALALGQVLTGQPLVGVWLVSAGAVAATYWMLLGCTSPLLATLGGVLCLAHPGLQLGWGQSYWGGSLAYIGGALVFGAALRMTRRTQACDAFAMAAGASTLAVTRPYEGLVVCSLVAVWLIGHWHRQGWPPVRELAVKLVLPQAVVLGAAGVALGAYHGAVTGSPWTFPYAVHESTYGQCPMFVGESPAPKPVYRHAEIDEFHSGWELDWHRRQSTLRGWVNTKSALLWMAAEFLFTPVIAAGVLLVRPVRWRRLRPVALIGLAGVAASLAVTWNLPHYLAPLAPLLFVAAAAGLRRVDALSRRRLGGIRLAPLLVAGQAALFAAAAVQYARTPRQGWFTQRAEIVDQLRHSPDRHLIVVRYGPGHSCHDEWVFNEADIDSAQVVWARAMDARRDAELLQYFGDRQAWLLEPEARRLVRLPRGATSLEPASESPSAPSS